MAEWERNRWTKRTQNWALLIGLLIIGFFIDGPWPDSDSSNRKRVFSPGFISLCVVVVTLELVILNGMYGEGR